MRPALHPRSRHRSLGLWSAFALVLALWLAQSVGLVHRTAHPQGALPSASTAATAASQLERHATHHLRGEHGTLHRHVGSPTGDSNPYTHEEGGSTCRLLDHLLHADGADTACVVTVVLPTAEAAAVHAAPAPHSAALLRPRARAPPRA